MALSTHLEILQVDERKAFAVNTPKSVIALVLTANVAVDINVVDLVGANPSTANGTPTKPTYLNFAGTGIFYVKWNGTGATVPASNVLDGTAPELTPSVRNIQNSITSFSVVSATAVTVTISIYTGI